MLKKKKKEAQDKKIKIRKATKKDFPQVWHIFQEIIAKGETYVNDESTTKKSAFEKWFDKKAKTYVAVIDKKIVGAYLIRANHVGRGSHVANCSYIVDEKIRGCGVGKSLAQHSIASAEKLGYKAIQFNFVVSTNEAAVKLWEKSGFKIIGTIPNGFNHKKLGFVDAYIMHLEL